MDEKASVSSKRNDGFVQRFEDDSAEESSDEDGAAAPLGASRHSAIIRIDLGNEVAAQMICKTLAVDKEPKRSSASRMLSADRSFLIANIVSSDRKYLQKSIDNLFDMCDLAKQTLDVVGKYRLNTEKT